MSNPNAPHIRRSIHIPKSGEPNLGPLTLLPGKWSNVPGLPGRGWNMIALPFATKPGSPLDYRLLVNQYNEDLDFFLVDKGVPNRGVERNGASTIQTDQLLVTMDYEQDIHQIASADFPVSGRAGDPGLAIHHEPGLWLHLLDQVEAGLDIARLASIPHGDSVLALGRSRHFDGPPTIPAVNGLPIGVNQDLNSPYLAPYKHFHDNLFENLFDPTIPHQLLQGANQGVTVKHTTELEVDTATPTGGISNIQFITKQANATSMKSTFWIEELVETGENGKPRLRLQYLQVILLEFFDRRDGMPGRIQWPHVSINTLEWVAETNG
jgi:hypothetical protein